MNIEDDVIYGVVATIMNGEWVVDGYDNLFHEEANVSIEIDYVNISIVDNKTHQYINKLLLNGFICTRFQISLIEDALEQLKANIEKGGMETRFKSLDYFKGRA